MKILNIKKIETLLTVITVFLITLVILSGTYLRPLFPTNILLGSLPNFVGAFVLYTLCFPLFKGRVLNHRNRLILSAVFVFSFLTIEEFYPFFTATKTFDWYDILANGIGVVLGYFFYFRITKLGDEKK